MSKNPEPKKAQQEQPAEQSPAKGGPQSAPMGVKKPDPEDRIMALELANTELEKRIDKLERNCRSSHGMRE